MKRKCYIKLNKIKSASGFTLIEVMVVVVIIAILAAIVVPRIMRRPDQAKVVAAKQDIIEIQNALELYKLDNGSYPSNAQGLEALVSKPTGSPSADNWQEGGYIQHLPVDPWAHSYHYANPGSHGNDIDIFTYGPNNKPGGKGMNATIGNWEIGNGKKSS